jgi:hypothetical protein
MVSGSKQTLAQAAGWRRAGAKGLAIYRGFPRNKLKILVRRLHYYTD